MENAIRKIAIEIGEKIDYNDLMVKLMDMPVEQDEIALIDNEIAQYFNYIVLVDGKKIECVTSLPGIQLSKEDRIKRWLPIARLRELYQYLSINALPKEDGDYLCFLYDKISETYKESIKYNKTRPGDSIPELISQESIRDILCEQAEKNDLRIRSIRLYLEGLYPYKKYTQDWIDKEFDIDPDSLQGQYLRWLCPSSVINDMNLMMCGVTSQETNDIDEEIIDVSNEQVIDRAKWYRDLEENHVANGLKFDYAIFNMLKMSEPIIWNMMGRFESILGVLLYNQAKLSGETASFRHEDCHMISNYYDYKKGLEYAKYHCLLSENTVAEERCNKFLKRAPKELLYRSIKFCIALSRLNPSVDIRVEKIGNVNWPVYVEALKNNIEAAKDRLLELDSARVDFNGWQFSVINNEDDFDGIYPEEFATDEEFKRQIHFSYFINACKVAKKMAEEEEIWIKENNLLFIQ